MATGTNGIATGSDLNAIAHDGKYFTDLTKCYCKSDILSKTGYNISGTYSDSQLVRATDVSWGSSGAITIGIYDLTIKQAGSNTTPFGNFNSFPLVLVVTIGDYGSTRYNINKNSGTVSPTKNSMTGVDQLISVSVRFTGYSYAYTSVGPAMNYSISATSSSISGGGGGGAIILSSPGEFEVSTNLHFPPATTFSDLTGLAFTLTITCNV